MGKKKTHEEYVMELAIKNSTTKVIESYIDAHTPILHHCTIHNVDWKIAPMNALKGNGCNMCHKERISQSHNTPYGQYKIELATRHPHIKITGNYINKTTPAAHYCEKHNVYWDATPHNVLKGVGCPMCQSESYRKLRMKSQDDYIYEVSIKNPNIEVIGDYLGANVPISHRCKKHNIIWNSTPTSILNGAGCSECFNEQIRSIFTKTHQWYVEQLAIYNPDIEVVDEYINMRTPIKHFCKIDNIYWDTSPTNALKGCGCFMCQKRRIGESNRKSHEQYVHDLKIVHNYIRPIEQYVNSTTAIYHICDKCGAIWRAIPHNLLSGRGCPGCDQSYSEQKISKWLTTHNIDHIPQYKFSDCKYKKPLPFDFYIPKYNVCIEYDGEQHFMPINFSGKGEEYAKEQLKIIQHRDKIKTNYCKINNIRLLRIAYNQNIDEELERFFSFEYSNITG